MTLKMYLYFSLLNGRDSLPPMISKWRRWNGLCVSGILCLDGCFVALLLQHTSHASCSCLKLLISIKPALCSFRIWVFDRCARLLCHSLMVALGPLYLFSSICWVSGTAVSELCSISCSLFLSLPCLGFGGVRGRCSGSGDDSRDDGEVALVTVALETRSRRLPFSRFVFTESLSLSLSLSLPLSLSLIVVALMEFGWAIMRMVEFLSSRLRYCLSSMNKSALLWGFLPLGRISMPLWNISSMLMRFWVAFGQ